MGFLNSLEKSFRHSKERSIADSSEYINSLVLNFNEECLNLERLLDIWPKDPSQKFLNDFEYGFAKIVHIISKIESDFKNTKEGKEYYDMERQMADKPNSLLAAEMFENIRGTSVEALPSMKAKLKDIEQRSILMFKQGEGAFYEGVDF